MSELSLLVEGSTPSLHWAENDTVSHKSDGDVRCTSPTGHNTPFRNDKAKYKSPTDYADHRATRNATSCCINHNGKNATYNSFSNNAFYDSPTDITDHTSPTDNAVMTKSQTSINSDTNYWKTVFVNEIPQFDDVNESRRVTKPRDETKSRDSTPLKNETRKPCDTKRAACKMLLHCLPNLFITSAFLSNQNLQSTINSSKGTGLLCLSSVYVFTIFGYLIVPRFRARFCSLVISIFSALTFAVYFASFATSSFYFQLATSCMVGVCISVLWIYSDTFLVEVIHERSRDSKHAPDIVTYKTSSLYDVILQTCHIWGNLITAIVFASYNNNTPYHNSTVTVDNPVIYNSRIHFNEPSYSIVHSLSTARPAEPPDLWDNFTYPNCGAHHLSVHLTSSGDMTSYRLVHIMLSYSYIVACFLSVVVSVVVACKFRNPVDATDFTVPSQRGGCLIPQCEEVLQNGSCPAVTDILKDNSTLLIVPFMIYIGLEQAFTYADLTKYYITCTFGLSEIGKIFTCYGAVVATTHLTVYIAYVWRQLKRVAVVAGGALINAILLAVLWRWRPHPGDTPNIYVVTCCLGFCHVIWQTHVRGLLAEIFVDRYEAQSAIYRICVSIGCAIGYTYSTALCARTKVYILSATLSVSLLTYAIFELRWKIRQKQKKDVVEL